MIHITPAIKFIYFAGAATAFARFIWLILQNASQRQIFWQDFTTGPFGLVCRCLHLFVTPPIGQDLPKLDSASSLIFPVPICPTPRPRTWLPLKINPFSNSQPFPNNFRDNLVPPQEWHSEVQFFTQLKLTRCFGSELFVYAIQPVESDVIALAWLSLGHQHPLVIHTRPVGWP